MRFIVAFVFLFSADRPRPALSWVSSATAGQSPVVSRGGVHSPTTSSSWLQAAAAKSPSSTQQQSAADPTRTSSNTKGGDNLKDIFDDFVDFLEQTQSEIIVTIEDMDSSGARFTNDAWGLYAVGSADDDDDDQSTPTNSGGKTRVLQGGDIVEKGACSLTLIRRGVLTAQRADAIRSRQGTGTSNSVKAGDTYAAAALSIVLHSRSPFIPTFRSDVRIFLVQSVSSSSSEEEESDKEEGGDDAGKTLAFFGGGADLTPYYLGKNGKDDFSDDITFFHNMYRDLAQAHPVQGFSYPTLKDLCDQYFYLPARSEHRGTGGIFFDDMNADAPHAVDFVKGVATTWMPSWLPIVEKRRKLRYTDQQKQWQLLRRGRYLEFNLLYDRGVAFGLQVPNPRVEGVMVSAPPLIAWEYNHQIEGDSEEARIMEVLKNPIDWAM